MKELVQKYRDKLKGISVPQLPKPLALPSIKISRLFAPKPALGIDIGSRLVKAVVAHPSSSGPVFDRGYTCLNVDETTLPTLRASLDQGGTGSMPAAFSIADERVELQEFHLPALAKAELETAIEWEVKKVIASPEYVFSDVLAYPAAEGHDVQCVIAGRDIVQSRFDEGKSLGVVPQSLETESSALLACATAVFPKRKMDRIAIVDLGYSSFRLIFVHNGRVSFTRALYFGLASITHQVSAQLGVMASDLESLFPDMGKGDAGAKSASLQSLERFFQENLYGLSEEFRRSEFYVRDQKSLDEVEEIFLCGGGACYPAAAEYLGRHLTEKKITLLDPFRGMKRLPPEVSAGSGPLWACAIGLSLRGPK